MATPLGRLEALLASTLSEAELRRLIRNLPSADSVTGELPGVGAPRNHLAHEVASLLARRGCIDAALFQTLVDSVPTRYAEIAAVAAEFGVVQPPPAAMAPARASSPPPPPAARGPGSQARRPGWSPVIWVVLFAAVFAAVCGLVGFMWALQMAARADRPASTQDAVAPPTDADISESAPAEPARRTEPTPAPEREPPPAVPDWPLEEGVYVAEPNGSGIKTQMELQKGSSRSFRFVIVNSQGSRYSGVIAQTGENWNMTLLESNDSNTPMGTFPYRITRTGDRVVFEDGSVRVIWILVR